ncbi:hypothetical protein [Lutibaculum baratangense]|uniref:Uncharacterized protein n=1 Tax=Lutibaculum baratangense AMV1 TaxID=631454 RepID=V4R3M0_9HYPH|nr:hypothetical protein [Lutibaculum baratangense]ESR26542.1 hypothetical protein N177_0761 [Lutibaculum baratangense AMV1]
MSAFDDFARRVLDGAADLARDFLKKGADEAREDADDFLRRSEEKLRRWAAALAEGKLKPDEFAFLVNSQKDLAELAALTRLGITQIELERFRQKLIGLVIDVALDTFL